MTTKTKANKDIEDIATQFSDNTAVKGINELMNNVTKDNIDIKTDLRDSEVKKILRIWFISETFNIKPMKEFCIEYMRLRLSSGRKSRQEIIDLIKADNQMEIEKSFGGRMKGMLGNRP